MTGGQIFTILLVFFAVITVMCGVRPSQARLRAAPEGGGAQSVRDN